MVDEKRREYYTRYRIENREVLNEKRRAYYQKNKEHEKAVKKEYYKNNIDQEKRRASNRERWHRLYSKNTSKEDY